MKSEAAGLLEPAGVNLEWRLLEANTGHESSHRPVVVRFTGTCASGTGMDAPPTQHNGTTILGTTAVVSGAVLPYSEVKCDAVRQFLPENQLPGNRHDRDLVLGKALGRILAHELYHALLRTKHHAHAVVAGAVQTPTDLRRDTLAFSPADFANLK
ncbi:MAG: hypothetical protein U0Q18_19815 [Bryobacteraceae bacterium]